MSLTTTCPSCTTVFKVVPDQLKLKRGLVRCGHCQKVFNGLEALRPLFDSAPQEPAQRGLQLSPNTPLQQALFQELPSAEPDLNTAFFLPEYESDPPTTAPDLNTRPLFDDWGNVSDDALERPHLPLLTPASAATDLSAPPYDTSSQVNSNNEVDAVDFFPTPASEKSVLARSFSRWAGISLLVLTLCALVQGTLVARHWIVASLPASEHLVKNISALFNLDLRAPRHLDALSLSSTEVRVRDQADQYQLNAVLNNRSRVAVSWPALLLVLNNPQGEAAVRRVILPKDYLSAPLLAQGIASASEHEIKLQFNAAQLKLGDYSLQLFYP